MRIVRVANCATLWSDCIITPQSWGRVLNVNDHAIEKSTSYLPEMYSDCVFMDCIFIYIDFYHMYIFSLGVYMQAVG